MVRRRGPGGKHCASGRPDLVRGGAFVSAAVFGLHPLATESVAYVSSQSVPLAACAVETMVSICVCRICGLRET